MTVEDEPLTPEQAVIGAALVGPDAHQALLALTDADFTDARNATVAAVIRDMIRARQPIDAATVAAELGTRGQLAKLPGRSLYLHRLYSQAPVPVMAMSYAEMVRSAARVRLVTGITADMTERLQSDEAPGRLDELLGWQRDQLDAIPGNLLDADPESHTLEALMGEYDRPAEWLIPGLIERGERIVLTGHEGHGKSVIMRQIAACAAAGVHPWTGLPSGRPPCRVLHVDAENSRRQIRNGYRMVRRIGSALPGGWEQRITVHVRADGLDLPGRDAGWLHQVAAECSPDLIVIGPAYKLMLGDPQKDRDVLALLSVLDSVRIRHNAAMIIEHHSPHGDASFGAQRTVRPYGSSVWRRWPEVGIGVAAHDMSKEPEFIQAEAASWKRPQQLDIIDWRPAREDRDWPSTIGWGAVGELPWKPYEEYTPSIRYDEEVPA